MAQVFREVTPTPCGWCGMDIPRKPGQSPADYYKLKHCSIAHGAKAVRAREKLLPKEERRQTGGATTATTEGVRERNKRLALERLEDYWWLKEVGEHPLEIARRLGVSVEGLQSFLKKQGLRDEVRAMSVASWEKRLAESRTPPGFTARVVA